MISNILFLLFNLAILWVIRWAWQQDNLTNSADNDMPTKKSDMNHKESEKNFFIQ